ncbi:MAG: hypothetical protein FJ288_12610 [Planctomycetes bacterium]|nr:hypothetical protein [Planctomycetota bacterium]
MAAVSISTAQAAETPPQRMEIELRLYGAVFRSDKPAEGGPTLVLNLKRSGNHWERVWGIAGDVTNSPHTGRVAGGALTDSGGELAIEMNIAGDAFTRESGGRARYKVTLARNAAGSLEGNYDGTYRDVPVKGWAAAFVQPPCEARAAPNFVPAKPGEHPRILFRAADLPRLREKTETPFGQAAMARMTDIIGLGIRYQLTGDRKLADEARAMAEDLMGKGTASDQFGHNVGDRSEKVAVAYDLCYGAWPPDFRTKVERYLVWTSHMVMFHQTGLNRGINWHVCSNWSAPLYTGVGFAGLALWREKGPQPPKPPPPATGAEVQPAADYTPGKGVPVAKFQDGEMPAEWIYVGGFKPAEGEDPLAAIGGAAKARPEVGASVSCGGRSETFRPLSREKDKGYWSTPNMMRGKDMIDITNAIGRVYFSTSFFYTVIENDKPRWVEVSTGNAAAEVYLAGVRLVEGDCARIDKGLYPVMVAVSIGSTDPWGRILMQPRLIEQTAEQAKVLVARTRAEHEERIKDWEYDVAEWNRLDGASVEYMNVFEMGRLMMRLHCREAVGTGGFQSEVGHYSSIATRGPARYAPAYRRMFGEDLSPYGDITHFVPRKMFAHVYPPGGKAIAQDINGTPGVEPFYFAYLFPIVPDEWKPAVLWGWNYHAGVTDKESTAKVLEWEPVYAFLNYPLDLEPRPPQGILPLAWEAPDFGYYAFRNRWEGKDDIIAQVFLRAHNLGGWNGPNGGTFRLLGLGHIWAYGPTDRNRSRWEENVVVLPENPEINENAQCRLTYVKTEKDGSGVVAMNMDDIYATAPIDEKGKKPRLYERYYNVRRDVAFKDSGITGLRSIAIDYSGKCGAPCLLVVVDKIAGGKSKVWVWQAAAGTGKTGKTEGAGRRSAPAEPGIEAAKAQGNVFTIDRGDTNLRGTFIAPSPVKLTAEIRAKTMIGGAGSSAGKTLDRPIPGIFAEGGDPTAGDFFVVVTLQRGDPPPVKVEGAGLAAKVTVGRRTVAFDGQKIVLGE